MSVRYLTNRKGENTDVVISMKDWEKLKKELRKTSFFNELEDSMIEIKNHFSGGKQLKDAKSFILNEL
jgi:hypothetical protein